MNKALVGSLAGALATIPMSWAMEVMHRAMLPPHQRHPLPPRLITERVTRAAGVRRRLSSEQTLWLSLAAHLGYGAAVGAVYEVVADRVPLRPMTRGTAYGLFVWAGSYLGWLPALGILQPATRHRARRNLVMIVAHLVWGSALAIFQDLLKRGSRGEHPAFLGAAGARRFTPDRMREETSA